MTKINQIFVAAAFVFVANVQAAPTKRTPIKTANPQPVATAPAPQVSGRTTVGNIGLQGLSLLGSFDMVDTFDFDANVNNQNVSGSFVAEKAFGFGAQYSFVDLGNGVSLNVGASYEMGRTITSTKIKNQTINETGAKPEVQLWVLTGGAELNLTQRFSVFGGGNYSIPSVKNISGSTWKGKFGYQVGGTFLATENLAVDAMLRAVNFSGSADSQGQNVNYDNVRAQGFALRGRYMF